MEINLSNSNNFRLHFLDSLRGIAALSVLLFHFSRDFFPSLRFNPFSYGYLGVNLFFIISGFVIYMTLEKTKSSKDFLISRFARLYPGYWVNVLITFFLIKAAGFNNLSFNISDLLVNFTMLQHWFLVPHIDGVYWTLTIELNFYFLMLFLFLINSLEKIDHWGTAMLIVMLITALIKKYIDLPVYFLFPILHYWHLFFAGILFYKIYSLKQNKSTNWLLIFCIGVQWVLYYNFIENVIISFIFIIFYLLSARIINLPVYKSLLKLGAISYSLYLFHEINGQILGNYLSFITFPGLRVIVVIIIVIIFSALITYYVEKPVQAYMKRKFKTASLEKR